MHGSGGGSVAVHPHTRLWSQCLGHQATGPLGNLAVEATIQYIRTVQGTSGADTSPKTLWIRPPSAELAAVAAAATAGTVAAAAIATAIAKAAVSIAPGEVASGIAVRALGGTTTEIVATIVSVVHTAITATIATTGSTGIGIEVTTATDGPIPLQGASTLMSVCHADSQWGRCAAFSPAK